MYIWFIEWQDIGRLERENYQIDNFRQEINKIHIQLIEFSLLGETILEWDDEELEYYHTQRMAMDSMLCCFKVTYPASALIVFVIFSKIRNYRCAKSFRYLNNNKPSMRK